MTTWKRKKRRATCWLPWRSPPVFASLSALTRKPYTLLPYEVGYDVWDAGHVLGETQLLAFAALGFALLLRIAALSAGLMTVCPQCRLVFARRRQTCDFRPRQAIGAAMADGTGQDARYDYAAVANQRGSQSPKRAGLRHCLNRRGGGCVFGRFCADAAHSPNHVKGAPLAKGAQKDAEIS